MAKIISDVSKRVLVVRGKEYARSIAEQFVEEDGVHDVALEQIGEVTFEVTVLYAVGDHARRRSYESEFQGMKLKDVVFALVNEYGWSYEDADNFVTKWGMVDTSSTTTTIFHGV